MVYQKCMHLCARISQDISDKISYSLYLWHWPVYILFRWTIGLESWFTMILAIVLTFALAVGSYHFVEMPVRLLRTRYGRHNVAIMAIGLASVIVVFMGYNAAFSHRQNLTLSVTSDRIAWYPFPRDEGADYQGPVFENRTLFAIGDSHAGAYATMLHDVSRSLNIDLHTYLTGDCQIGRFYYRVNAAPRCLALQENIITDIREKSRPGDVVFLASLRAHRLSDQWVNFGVERALEFNASPEYAQRLKDGVKDNEEFLKTLERLGLHIIIDAPKPVFLAPPFRCSDWFNKMNPVCVGGLTMEKSVLMELRVPMMQTLELVKGKYPSVTLWDPFPILCPGEVCAVRDADGPLFLDGDHITGHGNMVVASAFRKVLSSLMLE